MIETTRGEVPFDVMLGVRRSEPPSAVELDADHDHQEASQAFVSWTYGRDRAIDTAALLATIKQLPPSVYRIKGFLRNSSDPDHRYLLQIELECRHLHLAREPLELDCPYRPGGNIHCRKCQGRGAGDDISAGA
jgi:G3E family GTPase